MKRKLFLIFHGRFPSEKAAAVFTAKNAEAFSDAEFSVTVLVPRRFGRAKESPAQYYGVKNNFRTVYLPVVDLFAVPFLKRFAFYKSYATFSISALVYLLFSARRTDIIYSNEALPLLFLSFFFPKTFYEVHDFPRKSFVNRALLSRVTGVIATNRWKAAELLRRFSIPPERVLYEPNAVDTFRFGRAIGNAVRQKLPLPTGTVVIGYAGTLKTMGMEKGIEILIEALSLLPPRFRCLIIGGVREDIEAYRESARTLGVSDRVVFTGWMHYNSVPEHLAACDILVAPFPKTEHYDLYMSPMKLFEYMAVGKPIVATRLRAVAEVVGDDSAFLVEAGDSRALADGILAASSDPRAPERIARARELVKTHSWRERAERIATFILGEKSAFERANVAES